MSTIDKFEGKRILIWGFGREGQSTKHFLNRCVQAAVVDVFEGKREDIVEENYDYIIKSPGIIMEDDDPKYTSQTEIFLEEYSDRVIGITGTKGKSTTSSMLFHVLNECLPDKKVYILGNIGEPCLDYFDEVDEDTVIVFEMSCHQLAHVTTSPHISIFLNLYEEHLDYYKTFDKYFKAKGNITKYQSEEDFFLVGDEVPDIATRAKKTVINWDEKKHFDLKVLGDHNDYNATFVSEIAVNLFGIDEERVRKSLESFEGLAHRLQFIGQKNGVEYYDDSISTIPAATMGALKAIPNAYSVFIGGMDRGINYDELIEYIREHQEYQYIFSYDSGKRIYDQVSEYPNCHYIRELKDAVEYAAANTPEGKACVLSPASASYGYFKNFEQRGEMFREYVGL